MKAIFELWDNINLASIFILGIPEGEEKEKGIKNVFLLFLKKVLTYLFLYGTI